MTHAHTRALRLQNHTDDDDRELVVSTVAISADGCVNNQTPRSRSFVDLQSVSRQTETV